MLRAGVDELLTARGADLVDAPGGSTGLLIRQFQGKLERAVYRVDPGLVSLLAELRAHEKQAAEELGQWSEKREPAGDGTVAPTSITVRFVGPGEALSDA